jgi:hypothetical protein
LQNFALRQRDRFDLNLANADTYHVPLLPPPTLRDSIGQAMAVARLTTFRRQNFAAVSHCWHAQSQPIHASAWIDQRRREAVDAMAASALRAGIWSSDKQVIHVASAAAERADVVKIEELLRDVRRRDAQLGYRRPAEINGLFVALQAQLDMARGLRLARDRWLLRRPAVLAYESAIKTD